MEKQTKAEKKQVTEEYRFLAVFSKEILDSEERREQAIIDQAGRMQQAFSFVAVAVLAIVPLLLSWTKLSQEYILVFSSIVLTGLCLNLMLATIAQWRYKREDYPNIADLHEKMKKEFRSFETEEQRDKYYVETLAVIQKSLGERTDKENSSSKRINAGVYSNSFHLRHMFCDWTYSNVIGEKIEWVIKRNPQNKPSKNQRL